MEGARVLLGNRGLMTEQDVEFAGLGQRAEALKGRSTDVDSCLSVPATP